MPAITDIATLEALYHPAPVPNSTVKVTDRITPQYRTLIEASPFLALATVGRKASIALRAATAANWCASLTTAP